MIVVLVYVYNIIIVHNHTIFTVNLLVQIYRTVRMVNKSHIPKIFQVPISHDLQEPKAVQPRSQGVVGIS